MSKTYLHQEDFADKLTAQWLRGERCEVRKKLRTVERNSQAAYLAAAIADRLEPDEREEFINFIHPNNK